ncbi:MAG TPA: dienelactone hydrolase family protein [Polyangiaceae bacterium]|jgi:carboxymethylenebutenolidase
MGLKVEWIRYGTEPHLGYFCYPERAAGPLPSVLILQEAWGVDLHIQDVTRRFALAGYAAFAPDLFAKAGERIPALANERLAEVKAMLDELPTAWRDDAARDAYLAKKTAPERERIVDSFGVLRGTMGNQAAMLPIVAAAANWLRLECATTRGQKVAVLGFCLGGSLSGTLACKDPQLAAAVVFYGGPPPADLVPNVHCPVLGLYGSLDANVTPQVPAFASAMKAAGKRFEPVVYEGAQHAFFNDTRPAYHVGAARDAFARVLSFLRAELAS